MKRLALAVIIITTVTAAQARFYGPGATRAYMGEGMYAAASPTGRMGSHARAADYDDIHRGGGHHYAAATFPTDRPEHTGWGRQPVQRTFTPSGHVSGYGSTRGAGYY